MIGHLRRVSAFIGKVWPVCRFRVGAEKNASVIADENSAEFIVSKSNLGFDNHISIQTKVADADDGMQLQKPLGTSSFTHTTINLLGIMIGLGLLSTPYALEEGGWMSLGVLFTLAGICCYTAFALSWCLDCDSKVLSYQDIGYQAFGLKGRILVSTFLYVEIIFISVGYTISLGDNVSAIFTGTKLGLPQWLHLITPKFLTITAVLLVLPTLWVRDLSSISFLSWGGVTTSLLLMFALSWAGFFGGVGFHGQVPLLNFRRLPVSTGLYAFCYAGHVVFPTIYRSMRDPAQFGRVTLVSFATVTTIYAGFACLGGTMFGSKVRSQITLNMPRSLLVTKFALWATVITPMSKFALQLSPVVRELENAVASAWTPKSRGIIRIVVATLLLFSILAMAIALPYFGYVLSLTGSFLSITMSIILPCIFFLKIKGKSISKGIVALNVGFIIVGFVLGIAGTIESARNLINSAHGHGTK